MNANELADKLAKEWVLHDKNVGLLMQISAKFLYTQITMLRQQQAEIEALKSKTLTDEEIYACFHQYFVLGEPKPTHYELEYEDLIEFARAILRKASEK
jgi:hypothetical protein